MMKAAMRLQKNQLNPLIKLTSSGTFLRDRYLMFGYRNFDIMLVGGAGGRSGTHTYSTTHKAYSSGGGGGGSLRASGLLIDLPASVDYIVGAAGTNGANSTSGTGRAGNGTAGGDSVFDTFSAPGGSGAIGGGFSGSTYVAVRGGSGGGSTGVLLSEGAGGGQDFTPFGSDSPVDGDWHVGTLTGIGGGGGVGRTFKGTVDEPAQDGAQGCNTDAFYRAQGGPGQPSLIGGDGGGAGINPITLQSPQYYGSRATSPIYFPDGVIVLRLS